MERRAKNKVILCHPEVKRHVNGVCINCYSKQLKEKNPQYLINQRINSEKYHLFKRDKIKAKELHNLNAKFWRLEVLKKLGNVCVNCGYSDIRALHIDHVNGDGRHERNIRKSLNRKIALGLVDVNRYQLLCANCNWIKKIENNEN